MKSTVNHPTIGEIVYEESMWTGKKTISINGTILEQVDRKTFVLKNESGRKQFTLVGNYFTGVKINVDNETVSLIKASTWYEIVCSVIIFVFNLVWGNSVSLCLIVPIVGGAIGGCICGLIAVLNIFAMKTMQKSIF